MNFTLLNAVFGSRTLPPEARMIFAVMLNHADAHGRAWPTHSVIARHAGLCRRTVVTHMLALENAGWIVRVGRWGKVGVFTMADPTAAVPPSPATEAETIAGQPEPSAPSLVQEMPPHGASAANICANDASHGANGAGDGANDGRSWCTPCRLTTQEPINNPPKEPPTNQGAAEEEGMPPQGGGGVQKKENGVFPKYPDWRERNGLQAHKANEASPPHDLPQEFAGAWTDYQRYRTQRATDCHAASAALAWTPELAVAALRECQDHAQRCGWAAVVARIYACIGGSWRALHFDR